MPKKQPDNNEAKRVSESSRVCSTVDGYIAAFPGEVQAVLNEVRRTIRDAAPQAVEVIKYRIPTYVLNGNLVHFAAYKSHIGFYPTPSGIDAFKNQLGNYKTAKGSVQFPLAESIPLNLIESIVKYRVVEALGKSGRSKSKK